MRMVLMWWRSRVLKVDRMEGELREATLVNGRGLECRVVVVFKLDTPECEEFYILLPRVCLFCSCLNRGRTFLRRLCAETGFFACSLKKELLTRSVDFLRSISQPSLSV